MPFVQDSYAILPLQQGMLFHLFAEPESGIGLDQVIGDLPEKIEVKAFIQAWQLVLDRHPSLRTTYELSMSEEPRQFVHEDVCVDVRREDWKGLAEQAQEARLEQFLAADRSLGADPRRCPVWRLTLLELGEERLVFVFTTPHAVLDGRSLLIVLEEVFEFYEAELMGREIHLSQPPEFRRFVEWVQSKDRSSSKAYWCEKLQSMAGPLTLPLPRPNVPASGYGEKETALPEDLVRRLRNVASDYRVTLNILVKAAWAVVLSRLCGTDDVVFGEVRTGRRSGVKGLNAIVGLCINTVPVRVRLAFDATVLNLLEQIREDQISVRDHEHSAVEDVARWCRFQPGVQLFETLLVFDMADFGAVLRRKGGAWARRKFMYRERTSLPITLNVYAEPEFSIRVSYDRGRFSDEFMARIPAYLHQVLENLVADPCRKLSDLDLLPAQERSMVLEEWNRTEAPIPEEATIPKLFREQVSQDGDRVALICGGSSMTYEDLDERSDELARCLKSLGVSPGALVGICIERSIDMVVALFGVMKAGGGYVPLDPTYPIERLDMMVEDADPVVILTNERYAGLFPAARAPVRRLDELSLQNVVGGQLEPLPAGPSPGDLAYVIYTSGSTGRPKGVMLSQRNVVNCFIGMDAILEPDRKGTWLAVTSICFDISVVEIFWTLTRGFTVVLAVDARGRSIQMNGHIDSARRLARYDWPEAPASNDPLAIARSIRRHEITHLQCTPSLAKMLVLEPDACEAIRALRVLMLGGEAFPEELLKDLGNVASRKVINVYGPTETTIWSTAIRVDGVQGQIPVGRPIANTWLYVLDPFLRPVPVGIAGELFIGGEGVAAGYLQRPELTAERFLPNPFRPHESERIYRTGDLVRYREDGVLDFLGRLDHQIKIRGHRIELGEIEAVIQGRADVQDVVVVARQEGAVEPRLVAYVVPCPDSQRDAAELRQFLTERLPSPMIPEAFVFLTEFPLTLNGKIDRKALPAPELETLGEGSVHDAPRDPIEEILAQIWARCLSSSKFGVRDNFFSLGGNSLKVVRVHLAIRDALGVELPLQSLFERPTIEELARLIERPKAVQEDRWAVWKTYHPNGTRVPLIGIHGVESIFMPLARLLPDDLPFTVVTSHAGFDGRVPPYFPCRNIHEMAEHYLKHLREIHPKGPYCLIGFCMGGLITHEIARRLVQQGEEVAFVGLFNSMPHVLHQDEISDVTVSERVKVHFQRLAALSPGDQWSYLWTRVRGTLKSKWKSLPSRLKAATSRRGYGYLMLSRLGIPVSPEAALKEISAFGMRMAERHVPEIYPGKVWLFHGKHAPADIQERWAQFALGGVEAYEFPGDHIGMMSPPYVDAVVSQLLECLQSLNDAPTTSDEIHLQRSTIQDMNEDAIERLT